VIECRGIGDQVPVESAIECASNTHFEKVERQDELRERMLEPFPEYDYITGLNAYVRHLAVGTRNLSAAVTALTGVTSTEAAIKAHQDVTFFLFAMLSAHVSLRDYLYEKSKTLSRTKEFHDLVDAWKAAPVPQLILHVRNRVQHGAMLPGSLIIETRDENHPEGVGTIVLFDAGEEFWNELLRDVNRTTREYFEAEIGPQRDKLTTLLARYRESIDALAADIRAKFEALYAAELKLRDELERQLVAVQQWLQERGVMEVW
jgi:hypothetical protein